MLLIFYVGGDVLLVVADEVNSAILVPRLGPLVLPSVARAITPRIMRSVRYDET